MLVTFNGKTFDWPLLENRFTMTRAIRVPQLAAHLDLLHPARSLWRLRLGSVRLVELERHVLDAERLGWRREDDVASSLIPEYYFEYLRGGTGQPLASVVRHNQMDLRGLAALFGKINSLLESREDGFGETDSLDLFGFSQFLHRKGEKELAHSACAYALNAGLPAEFRPQATRELALMAKRRGEPRTSCVPVTRIGGQSARNRVCLRAAGDHYERHARDLAARLEFAQLGLNDIAAPIWQFRAPPASHAARRKNRNSCAASTVCSIA